MSRERLHDAARYAHASGMMFPPCGVHVGLPPCPNCGGTGFDLTDLDTVIAAAKARIVECGAELVEPHPLAPSCGIRIAFLDGQTWSFGPSRELGEEIAVALLHAAERAAWGPVPVPPAEIVIPPGNYPAPVAVTILALTHTGKLVGAQCGSPKQRRRAQARAERRQARLLVNHLFGLWSKQK